MILILKGWDSFILPEDESISHDMAFCFPVAQTFFHKPPGGLYSLPYLSEGICEDFSTLKRSEWWEVLFFIKKLEPKQQQEAVEIMKQNLEDLVSRKVC